jgi:hypothetical protein
MNNRPLNFLKINYSSEKHGLVKITLLGRESVHCLSPKVAVFRNRDPRPVARAGISAQSGCISRKMFCIENSYILKMLEITFNIYLNPPIVNPNISKSFYCNP